MYCCTVLALELRGSVSGHSCVGRVDCPRETGVLGEKHYTASMVDEWMSMVCFKMDKILIGIQTLQFGRNAQQWHQLVLWTLKNKSKHLQRQKVARKNARTYESSKDGGLVVQWTDFTWLYTRHTTAHNTNQWKGSSVTRDIVNTASKSHVSSKSRRTPQAISLPVAKRVQHRAAFCCPLQWKLYQ
jgi:hypothetical protein